VKTRLHDPADPYQPNEIFTFMLSINKSGTRGVVESNPELHHKDCASLMTGFELDKALGASCYDATFFRADDISHPDRRAYIPSISQSSPPACVGVRASDSRNGTLGIA